MKSESAKTLKENKNKGDLRMKELQEKKTVLLTELDKVDEKRPQRYFELENKVAD